MAYNESERIITRPIGITDVQKAIGKSSTDVATLCSANSINPMAKYKPVRYNKVGALTVSELQSTRYGFGTSIPSFYGNNTEPDVTWEYLHVRPNTDWSRLSDFENYYGKACSPLAISISGSLGDAIGVTFYCNSYVNNIDSDEGYYNPDYNLSVSNLFPIDITGNATLTGSYIAICIHDIDNTPNPTSVVVVTRMTLNDVLQSAVPTVVIYGTEKTISGVIYPAVSLLNDESRSGHTFRIIVGLIGQSSGPSTSSQAYKVYTNSTEIPPLGLTIYSLAFRDGSDRRDITLLSGHSIFGLTFQIQNSGLALTYAGTGTSSYGTVWKYTLSGTVQGTITTPSGHWSPEYTRVVLTIRSDQGFVVDSSGNRIDPPEFETPVDISDNNNGQGKTINFSSLFQFTNTGIMVYSPWREAGSIRMTACVKSLYEEIAADNTITVSWPAQSI